MQITRRTAGPVAIAYDIAGSGPLLVFLPWHWWQPQQLAGATDAFQRALVRRGVGRAGLWGQ
jgi:hypothetical protein